MFTYSTNLRGAVTTTLNTVGSSAILDEEEEKVICCFDFVSRILIFYAFQPATEAAQKDIELPPSWVQPLNLTSKGIHISVVFFPACIIVFSYLDFQKRYPNFRKTYFYKKTRVEKYAPYSMKDGIVLKVAEFADYDCKFKFSQAEI